jgi:hypothetical protein
LGYIASGGVLTFDYDRLWQRRFGSWGLGRGLGFWSGLLDGRRGLFCLCCRGLLSVPAQVRGFSAQVSTDGRQIKIDYYNKYYS